MADKSTRSSISKLIGTAAALAAAMLAQKTVGALWKSFTGHPLPSPEDETGEAGLLEIAAAAVISGAVVALVRVLAIRGAAHALR